MEILGPSVGGIALAFKAILTLPQLAAFTWLAKECPCCRDQTGRARGHLVENMAQSPEDKDGRAGMKEKA